VPTVAVIDGVKIQFYPDDHGPPHFHAEFAEHRAVIDIATCTLTRGSLPRAKLAAVLDWAPPRSHILAQTFYKALAKEPLERIR
jgi:Domain of unknown function (DUF4160)